MSIQQRSRKIVVFDFDKTITLRDTNLLFFAFVGRRQSFYHLRLLLYFGFLILRKTRIISNIRLKNIGLSIFIGNRSKSEVLLLCKDFVKTIKLNNSVVYMVYKNLEEGNRVLIVSASINEYIIALFPEVEIVGSILEYDSSIVKLKNHCYQEEKINRLLKIGVNKIDVLYTDSLSDLPLAKISSVINLVKNNKIIKCDSLNDFIDGFKW
jgi:phosphoserine phosphatase